MPKYSANNERIKRVYVEWRRNCRGCSEATLDADLAAIRDFEVYTKFRDFKAFHIKQAQGFKEQLREQTNARTGKPLSAATIYARLNALKAFFKWLADKPGYKSRIAYSDADYFSPDRRETAIAKAHREQRAPTLEQIRHVVEAMPCTTAIEKRNRALLAFTILSGTRVNAIISMKLRDVDIMQERVDQDARTVSTKFSKTFSSVFFPVGDDIRAIVVEWVGFLRTELMWGLDDPLFPATLVRKSGKFEAIGLERRHWKTTQPMNRIFREAFETAGLPYYNPHSFRRTLGRLSFELDLSDEQKKAWSQNFGHDNLATTMSYYAHVPFTRQAELIRELADKSPCDRSR
jgi:integrase